MRVHERFQWDADKARTNLRKHGVGFELEAEVLADARGDRFHVDEYDDQNSIDEDRWLTTASHPADRDVVLRIVWTERQGVSRVISARLATPKEKADYDSQIYT